jgi:hypothetical protein
MSEMFKIRLPDGSVREVEPGTSPADVAAAIGPGLWSEVFGGTGKKPSETCSALPQGLAEEVSPNRTHFCLAVGAACATGEGGRMTMQRTYMPGATHFLLVIGSGGEAEVRDEELS